ncbi:MAG: hypothetical protein WCU88_06450 [Elusimicrobiota bacterium]|jgi:hypothetical protein
MKAVSLSCAAVLALSAAAQAFEMPQYVAAEVEQPAATVSQTGSHNLPMSFTTLERANEVADKIAAYLGPRLVAKNIVEKGKSGAMMNISYTGAPLSVWLAVYYQEDAPEHYYMGPKMEDAAVAEWGAKSQQELDALVTYLQTPKKGYLGLFAKPAIPVVYSYVTMGRVGGHSARGEKIEICSPFPYLILDGFIPNSTISKLNRLKFRPVFLDPEQKQLPK